MENFTEGAVGDAEVWDGGWESHWQESTVVASVQSVVQDGVNIPLQAPRSRGCEGVCHIPPRCLTTAAWLTGVLPGL